VGSWGDSMGAALDDDQSIVSDDCAVGGTNMYISLHSHL